MAARVGARARADVRSRYGVDILSDVFELHSWRDLQGDYITRLLRELCVELKRRGLEDRRIGVGVARGDVLGPPLGNTALHWRDWIGGGLIDHLIVNQNSSQCPSMWHQLWPMHRGGGTSRTISTDMAFRHWRIMCERRTHLLSMGAGRSCSWRDSGLSGAPMRSASSARFPVSRASCSALSGMTTRLRSREATGELVHRADNPR
jgi:hypothetical protein